MGEWPVRSRPPMSFPPKEEAAFRALVAAVERYPYHWSDLTLSVALAALDRIDPAEVVAFLDAVERALGQLVTLGPSDGSSS